MIRLSAAAIATLLASGCFTSQITPLHQAHATMASGAGELRGSARIGPSGIHGMTARGRVAYSPVDALVVGGAVDVDPVGEDEHYGGEAVVGAYVPDQDVLRFEGLFGIGAGATYGYAEFVPPSEDGEPGRSDLSGAYVQPFVQMSVGFAVPFFEGATGARLAYTHTDFDIETPRAGDPARGRTDWLQVQPFIQLAVPIELMRLEAAVGLDLAVAGRGPEQFGVEVPVDVWAVFGVGFQLDVLTGEPPGAAAL